MKTLRQQKDLSTTQRLALYFFALGAACMHNHALPTSENMDSTVAVFLEEDEDTFDDESPIATMIEKLPEIERKLKNEQKDTAGVEPGDTTLGNAGCCSGVNREPKPSCASLGSSEDGQRQAQLEVAETEAG